MSPTMPHVISTPEFDDALEYITFRNSWLRQTLVYIILLSARAREIRIARAASLKK